MHANFFSQCSQLLKRAYPCSGSFGRENNLLQEGDNATLAKWLRENPELDKRLIGGRSQFVSQALTMGINNNQVKKIEKKKLHIIQREISFPGYKNPVTFTVVAFPPSWKTTGSIAVLLQTD